MRFSIVDGTEEISTSHSLDKAGGRARLHVNYSVLVHDTMAPLEQPWRALEKHNVNSLHQGYDWCRAWERRFRRPLRIVECREENETVFILPLEVVRGRLFTCAQFIGADHSNVNTGLFTPGFLQSATPELMAGIAERIKKAIAGVDCIMLTNMPDVWRNMSLPFSLLPFIENQNKAFQLSLKDTFVETLSQLNAKRRRKKYSASHRRLEAMGGYEHIVTTTDSERHTRLDLFFTQKGARLAEFGLPNAFACPKTRGFLHDALDLPESEGNFALRMHSIRMTGGAHKGEIPAIAGLSRKGDHIIVQFCSIGQGELVEASPGELLFHLMIEQYNADNVRLFDFGIGEMAFKRSWCNQETTQVNVNLPVTSLGRLAALKEEASTRLKTVVKQNPALYYFLQRIRSKSQATQEQNED